MTLGSKATALPLYEEVSFFYFHRMILNDLESNKLQKDLHDAQLQEWIDRSRVAVTQELENQREHFLNHLPFHVFTHGNFCQSPYT